MRCSLCGGGGPTKLTELCVKIDKLCQVIQPTPTGDLRANGHGPSLNQKGHGYCAQAGPIDGRPTMSGEWEPLPIAIIAQTSTDKEDPGQEDLRESSTDEEEIVIADPLMMMMAIFMIYYVTQLKPDAEILDLCPIQGDDMEIDEGATKGWRRVDVTLDSGAANSVMDGDAYPNIPREESEGSRRGLIYQGPGSERIANRGKKSFRVKPHSMRSPTSNMTFQDAKVRKPLAAVSDVTAKDNIVLFDKMGSFIAPASCPEVVEIRKLINKIKNRIELEEKRGVYIMPVWIEDRQSGFTRQGA